MLSRSSVSPGQCDAMAQSDNDKTLQIPPAQLQVLAHYYRAEVYRSCVWRTRLDVTTNWAMLTLTAAFSWGFTSGEPEAHVVFPITSCIVALLLFIESRRYRFFDLWQTRARLLEGHLIVPCLNPELRLRQGNWREFLSNDLLLPTFKISFWEAFVRRLANIYVYHLTILFLGWAAHVYTHSDTDRDKWVSAAEFVRGCGYRFVHPAFTLCFELGFMTVILTILVINWKGRNVTGEVRRRDSNAPRWPI